MRRFITYSLKIILLAIVVAGVGLSSAEAREDAPKSGLTISPTSADITVPPGGSYSGQMQVLNQSELDAAYKIYATPYSVDGEEYKPYFMPIKDAVDISKWFTLKSQGNAIKVGEQNTIPYTINVPKDTGAGSYFATIFAETEDKETTGVVTRKRVGMIVYLRVSGQATERGEVTAWNVKPFQQPPFAAEVKIANSGSVHFKAKVTTRVSDPFGGQKFSYTQDAQILPQKQRRIPTVWKNGTTFGLFKVNGEVEYLGKTEKLPTRFVFIASTTMRIIMVSVLILVCIALVYLGKRRVIATPRKKR